MIIEHRRLTSMINQSHKALWRFRQPNTLAAATAAAGRSCEFICSQIDAMSSQIDLGAGASQIMAGAWSQAPAPSSQGPSQAVFGGDVVAAPSQEQDADMAEEEAAEAAVPSEAASGDGAAESALDERDASSRP